MGKTKRRNPYDAVDGSSKKRNLYAQDLGTPKYRQRVRRDKRKEVLEKLNESPEDFEDWELDVQRTNRARGEGRKGSRAVGSAQSDPVLDPLKKRNEG